MHDQNKNDVMIEASSLELQKALGGEKGMMKNVWDAIKNDDSGSLRLLIKIGADVNRADRSG